MYTFRYLPLLCSLVTAQLRPQWVHFDSDGISIAAHLYIPPSNSTWNTSRPAIVVGHPHGSVKEQSSGLYARQIAERTGFVTLAFDAAYQGESGGLPRYLEDPYQRANDVRNAVTYLATLDVVNATRIGALGVCASGGYVPFAAQTDERIRAVATVSGIDLGTLYSEGFGNYGGSVQPGLRDELLEAGRQRIREAEGAPPNLTRIFPQTAADVTSDLPVFYQQSYDYYQTPRGHVETAPNWHLWRSIDLIATYRSYAFMDLISPRPLLMIAGSEADTLYFTQAAIDRAQEPKEMYVIPGMTHIDLYDHTSESTPKLVEFFTANL
ncbi:putative dienelactone hydrolase domain-containing protein [Aspergillus bombycis]|uniref:Putative dienelactone hydrolase domain-containing protein n=1 Tax=Aspergillus bombycis TaxID=109264 RepID=A0A1F7ZX02_9EURO|nr:putative dienelactone hydrolase domain-containing protein [Aspergillus bombycis]OGM43980.1 putative dienelactone hydrolase domain-containing protein [Aspergillus bombycis]